MNPPKILPETFVLVLSFLSPEEIEPDEEIVKRLRFVNQQFNQLIQDYVDHLPRKEIKDTATLSDNSIELPEQEFKLAKWGKCWFFRELQVKQLEETIKALKKHATENGPIVACETTFEILSTKEFNLWKTDPQLFDQLITMMDLLSFNIENVEPNNAAYLIENPSLFHSAHAKKLNIYLGYNGLDMHGMSDKIVEFLADQSAPLGKPKEVTFCEAILNAQLVVELLCKKFLKAKHPGKFYGKIQMSQLKASQFLANTLCTISGLKEVLRESNIDKFCMRAIANNLLSDSNIELVNDLRDKVEAMEEEIHQFSISILEAHREDVWKMCICCFHYLNIENDKAYFLLLVTFVPPG